MSLSFSDYCKKFPSIACYMSYFLEATYYDDERRRDEYVVNNYTKITDSQGIIECLQEGKEILSLEPFPWKFIENTANIAFHHESDYKQWVAEMLEMLEKEAIAQGKIHKNWQSEFKMSSK